MVYLFIKQLNAPQLEKTNDENNINFTTAVLQTLTIQSSNMLQVAQTTRDPGFSRGRQKNDRLRLFVTVKVIEIGYSSVVHEIKVKYFFYFNIVLAESVFLCGVI